MNNIGETKSSFNFVIATRWAPLNLKVILKARIVFRIVLHLAPLYLLTDIFKKKIKISTENCGFVILGAMKLSVKDITNDLIFNEV